MASLSHRQGGSFALLLAIFPVFLYAGADKDSSAIAYRTGTSEVRVTFFATNKDNRPVENISRNDFAVVDGDMVIRDFRSLARSDETKLDIVLLIDASESVAPRFRAMTDQVLRLVSQNKRGDDYSIIAFAGLRPVILCQKDCETPALENKLHSLTPSGSTAL